MKNTIILFFACSILSSCVINPEPIDVIIPEAKPELVVSSFSVPPAIFAIAFTNTFSAISGITDTVNFQDKSLLNNVLIDSAEVYIDYKGKSKRLQKLLPGIYGSLDIELIENEVYSLKAIDLKTKREINATTKLMPKVQFDSLKSVLYQIDDTTSTHSFKYTFFDKPGTENYYLVTVSKPSFSILSGLEKTLSNLSNVNYQIYSDKLTGDGEKISFSPEFTNFKANDTLLLNLSQITKSHFDYLTAYKKSGSIFNSFLSEPVRSLPTNVVGGFGFFGITFKDPRVLILE